MNRYRDPVLALFAVQCVPFTTAWAQANLGGTFARTTLGKGSASPTYFGPFSSGTESAWCQNSASLGKRVSRQSVGCGPGGSGRSHGGSQICWHNHVKGCRMRVISTRTHGAIDYATGAGLLGISDEPAASRTLRAAGLAAMAYSLLTDYEYGLLRIILMPAHLAMDAASGVLLAASPWLFGFAGRGPRYRLSHVVIGLAEVLAALTSKTR